MTTFEFTLVMAPGGAEDRDVLESALFESGCDDALLLQRDGVWYLNFDRESEGLLEALMSAIHDVEQAGVGLVVLRIEPDEFVTASEIATRSGRSRESVRLLVTGQRGRGGFPAPVHGVNARTRLWRWSDVAVWLAEHDVGQAVSVNADQARTIAMVNAALQLRQAGVGVPTDILERLAG